MPESKPKKSKRIAYQVELQEGRGCTCCGEGQLYDIIGPDGVAHSESFGFLIDAQERAEQFHEAYMLGKKHGRAQEREKAQRVPPGPGPTVSEVKAGKKWLEEKVRRLVEGES